MLISEFKLQPGYHYLMEENLNDSAMREQIIWKGKFTLWTGGGGYVGYSSDTKIHAHHAHQLCFALDEPFRLRSEPSQDWIEYSAAFVASDVPHQFDGRGNRVVLIYLDPESEDARRILNTFTGMAIQPLPTQNLSSLLLKLSSDPLMPISSIPFFKGMITVLGGETSVPGTMDQRVIQVIRFLNSFDEEIPTLHSLALKVSLSPSRLGHLFREQTGLPLRQYRLWLRLQKALEALTQTHSLTVAAHMASFADSAHLSRTFRRMFGIAPSELKVESNQGRCIPIK